MVQPTTIEFLKELKTNNSKSWFDQNRKRYDKVKADYISLAGNILGQMKKVDPSLEMVETKECVFRINRDIRFSTDKSPYKTNLGIALHPGGKKFNLAAYYLHIEPGNSFIGGGLWMPEAPLLSKVRKEIHYFYHDLVDILNNPEYKKTFGSLNVEDGHKLSRPPKGYEAEDPAIEFLKLKSFTASTPLPDETLTSDKFLPHVIDTFTILKPLIGFINRGLLSDPDGGL